MKNCILLLLLLCAINDNRLWAQGENNIWCFGRRYGLDFNGPSPLLISSKVNAFESSASVCDAAGNLLFYMGADTVWDKNHEVLQNGTGMLGNKNGSSGRGVAIAQSLSAAQQYFLFVTDAVEQVSYNIYYSVVDMSLNGGLGGIVPGMKNILLDTGVTEPINIITKAGCDGYWLLLHRRSSKHYLAYSIDAAGIAATPVVSTGILSGNAASMNSGIMQFNNSGTRTVLSLMAGTEFAAFDNSTGIFSNFQILDTLSPTNFIFSPNDSKLYMSALPDLYQGDFSLMPNLTAFKNSIVRLDTAFYAGARIGPDNKIYILRNTLLVNNKGIARIQDPDNSGTSCNLDPTFMSLPPSPSFGELGTPVPKLPPSLDTTYSSMDTQTCSAPPLVIQGNTLYQSFLWSTGSTQPQESFFATGTYWLIGRQGCIDHIDSFHITFHDVPEVELGPDTSICSGDTLALRLHVPGASYLWQDGSRDSTFTITQKGQYTVQVSKGPCRYIDSIIVDVIVPSLDIPQPDTTLCSGVKLTLHAEVSPASNLTWNTGESGNQIEVSQGGVYRVTAINPCGTFTDSVTIATETCICNTFIPNAFSPNNDGKNEVLEVKLNCPGIKDYQFSIYNRYGQRVFQSNTPGMTWDGTIGQQKADIGTYFYYLRYKDTQGNTVRKKGDITLLW